MNKLEPLDLDHNILGILAGLQSDVDKSGNYRSRVACAKEQWKRKSRLTIFKEVRAVLRAMSGGSRKCCYCDDSVADELEHFRPKDLYPSLVFSWSNYLYACGTCNRRKDNHFAIVDSSNQTVPLDDMLLDGLSDLQIETVLENDPAIIDPRVDDPIDFLWLDIGGIDCLGTFLFKPNKPDDPVSRVRAQYTIDVLGLNDTVNREELMVRRARACKDFMNALRVGQPEDFTDCVNLCVWKEIKRQRELVPEIQELFDAASDPDTW